MMSRLYRHKQFADFIVVTRGKPGGSSWTDVNSLQYSTAPLMRIERVVRYGFVGTVGLSATTLLTFWLIREVERSAGSIGTIRILIAGVIGTFVALMFLFALIDALVDEKFETHGRVGPEEE